MYHANQLYTLPINNIIHNNNGIDQSRVDELATQLAANKCLPPLLCRPSVVSAGFFELVQGRHQYEAARRLGHTNIYSFIRDMTDQEVIIHSLEDNDQRPKLSTSEEDAYVYKLYTSGMSIPSISSIFGKCEVTIKDMILRHHYLSDDIKQLFDSGAINKTFASQLCKILKPWQFSVYTQLSQSTSNIKTAFSNYLRLYPMAANRGTLKNIPRAVTREILPTRPVPPQTPPMPKLQVIPRVPLTPQLLQIRQPPQLTKELTQLQMIPTTPMHPALQFVSPLTPTPIIDQMTKSPEPTETIVEKVAKPTETTIHTIDQSAKSPELATPVDQTTKLSEPTESIVEQMAKSPEPTEQPAKSPEPIEQSAKSPELTIFAELLTFPEETTTDHTIFPAFAATTEPIIPTLVTGNLSTGMTITLKGETIILNDGQVRILRDVVANIPGLSDLSKLVQIL